MKRFFLILAFLLVGFSAIAQERKIPAYLGGDFGVSIGSGHTSIVVYPEVGWRVTDNLYAGVQAGFGYYEGSGYSDFSVGIIPHLRYYYYIYQRFGVSAEAGMRLGLTRRSGNEGLIRSFDVGIRPGLVIPIGARYAVTLQVGFIGYESERYGDIVDGHWGFRLQSNDFRVGFLLNL